MSMFTLETRPSSPSRIGHAILVGVFCAVGVMFAARWFVAYDYATIEAGDSVNVMNPHHEGGGAGVIQEVRPGEVVVKNDRSGKTWTVKPNKISER